MAVHCQIGLALDLENQILPSQARPQTRGHLFSQMAEVEDALIREVSVGCHLLERLD